MTKRTYVELGLSLQTVGIRWNNHSKMLLLKDTLTNNSVALKGIYSLFMIAMWTYSLLAVPQKFQCWILPTNLFDQQKSSVDQPTLRIVIVDCHLWGWHIHHRCASCLHQLLVGGAITILKNMSSSMGRMTSHMKWKIPRMFETTNQTISTYSYTNPDLLWIFTTLWSG